MLEQFEQYLKEQIEPTNLVEEAMSYALLVGGKRMRPLLLLSLLKDFEVEEVLGYPAATALEMIHTYSLVHDDLPAMDNDDYRRGQLTVHRKYGEDIAILAGDGLLTEAFKTAINSKITVTSNLKVIELLSEYSGTSGMIYGQELDLTSEGKQLELAALMKIHYYKTGKLFTLALLLAAVIAEREDTFEVLKKLGEKIGLAFQIQDDIFDVTKTLAELGKESSDEKNQKVTYVSLLGLEEAQVQLEQTFTEVFQLLDSLQLQATNLADCITAIKNRSF